MRFTRSNGTAPWRVHCEDFGTAAAAAIVDTKTGKKVAFAVDQIALGFPDSYLNLSHGDLMLDALNVHEATGLTPSQLQARVAELEAAQAADKEGIDYTLKAGDVVTNGNWTLTSLIVVDVNWALRAIAVRLGENGGVVVWPAKGLRRV